MEHLFKLKKDGKTVGYEHHIQEDLIKGKLIIIEHKMPYSEVWFDALEISRSDSQYEGDLGVLSNWIDHDEKYPFVCKDKNGKDVFFDDKVKANGIVVVVMWDATECRYMLSSILNQCCYSSVLYDNMGSKFVWSQIELIKDKENENNP